MVDRELLFDEVMVRPAHLRVKKNTWHFTSFDVFLTLGRITRRDKSLTLENYSLLYGIIRLVGDALRCRGAGQWAVKESDLR